MNRRLILIRRILLGIALFLALVLLGLDRYAAMVHRPSPTSTRVAIYTTARCPYCERLRRDLKASGVPYQEYDVERSLQGQMGFWTLHARGVPVSVIGPAIIYGYRVDEIQEALRKLGYAYRSTSRERTL